MDADADAGTLEVSVSISIARGTTEVGERSPNAVGAGRLSTSICGTAWKVPTAPYILIPRRYLFLPLSETGLTC